MITDIGFCPSCTKNVLDFPGLKCPWCNAAAPKLARSELDLDPDATPAERMLAASELIAALVVRLNSAKTFRSLAARDAIAAGNLPAQAVDAHCRVATIEKWARVTVGPRCGKGHLRSEHGTWDGQRWRCQECKRLRKPPKKEPEPVRVGKVKIRNQWAQHERRMAERARLAAAGQLPARLNEPLPPPVARRSG